MIDEFLFDRALVEPSDRAQPPGDGCEGRAPALKLMGEGLDIGAADGEQGQGAGPAPGGELAMAKAAPADSPLLVISQFCARERQATELAAVSGRG